MTNPNNIVQGKHLESLASESKRYVLEEISELCSALQNDLTDFVGASETVAGEAGFVPAPAAGDNDKFLRGDGEWALPTVSGGGGSSIILSDVVLDTVPSGFDGGMFYKATALQPYICLHYNNRNYSFATYEVNFDGDPSQYLFSHLTFNSSPTADECNNFTWTAYGSPTIGTANAIRGNALQLNGSSDIYTTTAKSFGGQDFTIDFYGLISQQPTTPERFFELRNTSNFTILFLAQPTTNTFQLNFAISPYGTEDYHPTYVDLNINQRYHFAISYFYNLKLAKFFIDGELVDDISVDIPAGSVQKFTIGDTGEHIRQLHGTIDEFRIHNGVALWGTNFTPPTADDY